jgi:superfamily I DNA/RNA helicase/RecB family exonuclease
MSDEFQRAAVAHDGGPAIVLAGPGSGKTRVIVERAVRLIDEGLARPEELLVLTFSRKAAADLRERIVASLQRSYASFPVTTFHAFCLALLTRNAAEPPRVARPAQRRSAAGKALAAEDNLGLRPTNTLVDEALAFAALCDDYLETPAHPLARMRARYVSELGALDYGGLQREAVVLLEHDDEARQVYQRMFRYVLVDEYQDTNVAQERLLELIAGDHRNLFCVADEDQSIYGFRGAEIENTLGFLARWPGARRYDLPTNYRSAPRIVEAATSVIERNVSTHIPKELTAAEQRSAELVGRTFRHAAEEAGWIAREVAALRLQGVEEIAVLARSLKEIGPRLAYELRAHEIPYHAPLHPQLHPTADALLSLLELAGTHPWESADDDKAVRVLASPLFGADPLELRRFRRERRTLYGSLKDSGEHDDFFEALGILKRQRSAGGAIFALWERLPRFRELQVRDATREQIEELEAVTALSDAANEHDGASSDFARAFRAGELADEEWLPARPPPPPSDSVALLTVHQAKGLEWDAVFVCDLVEGRFPALARSQHALFDRELFGGAALDEAEKARRALEEERRLFYVGLTRARTHVFLTATEEAREEAGRALSRFYLEASGFLADAPTRNGFVSATEATAALRRAGGGEPGWRNLDETGNPSPMLPSGGIWTSATRLEPYENCPLQFFLGSLVELGRVRTTPMRLGGAFHDVVERFHDPERNEPQTLERLLELATEQSFDDVHPRPLAEEQRRQLDAMLRTYYEHEVAPGCVGEVLAVERRFRFELGASTLSGYIDRIDRLSDGVLRLVDYKTSKGAKSRQEAEEDLQLALYALACREVPELRELGEVGELVYLYPRLVSYGRCTSRKQTVAPDLTERTEQRIRDAIASIVAERFDFADTADCQWCEFKNLCPRHYGASVPL